MYEGIATLIRETGFEYDEYGNEIPIEERREVMVKPRTVFASEFYQAAQAGLHPSLTLEISTRADYQGELKLEYEGRIYYVIRTDWYADRDKVSLICEERIGDGE